MKLSRIVLVGALTATCTLVSTGVASASTELNGVCESSETCFYWGPGRSGAVYDISRWVPDFAGARFVGGGQGAGEPVKNNAASVWENSGLSQGGACVHYNENYRGPYDYVPGNTWRDLNVTRNDNASYNYRNSEQDCRAQS